MVDVTLSNRIIAKVGKIAGKAFFADVRCIGVPTELWPLNLYFEMESGLRFYIAFQKTPDRWGVDYTRDSSIDRRADMTSINGLRNQTEALKLVKCLIDNAEFTVIGDRIKCAT